MKAAGFAAEDMHGFIPAVPAGFAEPAYWPSKDVRDLEHPELKKQGDRQTPAPSR